jgi:hypothetical protein
MPTLEGGRSRCGAAGNSSRLQDAGTYITKLPKAEHTAAEWQAAMEALILVAALGGPTMSRGSASCER